MMNVVAIAEAVKQGERTARSVAEESLERIAAMPEPPRLYQ